MRLPWSTSEYTQLLPTDLDGSAPTPEARIRVAAAVATKIRDGNIIRGGSSTGDPNAETIRCLLTMSEEEWRDSATALKIVLGGKGYDTRAGEHRYKQIYVAQSRGRSR